MKAKHKHNYYKEINKNVCLECGIAWMCDMDSE